MKSQGKAKGVCCSLNSLALLRDPLMICTPSPSGPFLPRNRLGLQACVMYEANHCPKTWRYKSCFVLQTSVQCGLSILSCFQTCSEVRTFSLSFSGGAECKKMQTLPGTLVGTFPASPLVKVAENAHVRIQGGKPLENSQRLWTAVNKNTASAE